MKIFVMKCNLRITGIYINYVLVACRQCFEICTREFGIETWNYKALGLGTLMFVETFLLKALR